MSTKRQNTDQFDDGQEGSGMSVESGTVALLNKSEIDMQVATAHKYPRSIKKFRDESLQMVTLSESVAESCIYALPRDGKVIEGPSARFAEVIASAWGNCRAGARVVNDQGEFITAQGVFHDLERNVAITFEVQRRITDKQGRRYKPDMVGVTGNAASSIALRNAILKGIPKAFWDDMYQAARQTVMGDFKTLGNRRADALKAFLGYGISPEQIFSKLDVAGIEDIGLEHLVTLRGLLTAIKEGDTTPDQAFAPDSGPEIGMPAAKKMAKENPSDNAIEAKPESKKPHEPEKEANPDLASTGERSYLTGKCESLGITLADAALETGITDVENLTKDGFVAIRDLLVQKERAV